jgi:flagellar biosynthesis protein FlhA
MLDIDPLNCPTGFLLLPMIRLRDNIQLKPNEYIIKIKGVETAGGELRTDSYMVMNPTGGPIDIDGIETKEPAFGLQARWISSDKKEIAEMKGYTIVDASSVLATHLTEVIKHYAHELLGWQEVKNLLDNLKDQYPALVEEIVPKILTIGEIQKVLSNLLKENVPIRDIVTILETLGDYATLTKDTDMLTEYVRQRLKRVITERFVMNKIAKVVTLDSQVEDIILDSIRQSEQGSYAAIEPSIIQKIRNSLVKIINDLNMKGISPIVLTSPMVRVYFKRIIEDYISFLPVLSYNELEPGVEVQSVGTVTL